MVVGTVGSTYVRIGHSLEMKLLRKDYRGLRTGDLVGQLGFRNIYVVVVVFR